MTTVFLFDIDLTLIRTNCAGSRAMDRTFHYLYGIPEGFSGIEFAGRTDGAILRDCYVRHALHERDLLVEFESFRERYFNELADELRTVNGCEVLPGVESLLGALADRGDVRLGLGTGNYRSAAELKLRHVGLWQRFAGGGFADDSEDRAEVIAAGIRRLLSAPERGDARIWIVGDSRHDVFAGKANGAHVVGVGTGRCSPAELSAAGADVVMDDLADTRAFIEQTCGRASI